MQDGWLGRWPTSFGKAEVESTLRVLRDADALARLEGPRQQTLVEIFVSTEHLTAGRMTLLPGRRSHSRTFGGDLSLYLDEGELFVRTGREGEQQVFEVGQRDGFYLPSGVPAEFFNYGDRACRFLFGVAPNYLEVP